MEKEQLEAALAEARTGLTHLYAVIGIPEEGVCDPDACPKPCCNQYVKKLFWLAPRVARLLAGLGLTVRDGLFSDPTEILGIDSAIGLIRGASCKHVWTSTGRISSSG